MGQEKVTREKGVGEMTSESCTTTCHLSPSTRCQTFKKVCEGPFT